MVKFELDLQGLSELFKSNGVQNALYQAGQQVAKNAGQGFAARKKVGHTIAFCDVNPVSETAARKNEKDNTLLKALSASGLRMSK